jgi:hypothetical protein
MQVQTHATMAQVPWQSICKAHSASWGPYRERTDRPRRLDRCQMDRTCMAHATCLQTHVRYARTQELDWPYSLLWEDCGHRRRLRPSLAGESPSTCFEQTRHCSSACEACFLRHSWPDCQPAQVVVGCGEGQCWQEGEQAEDRSVAGEKVSRGEREERTLTTPLLVELKTVALWTTGGLLLVVYRKSCARAGL